MAGTGDHEETGREILKASAQKETRSLVADYMEEGFLDNIISMFKADPSLYSMVADWLRDERLRVRMGITALMEELHTVRPDEARLAVPGLLPLLGDDSPTVRGDAAYLVGLVGDPDQLESLRPLLQDSNSQVAEIVRDILHGDD